MTKRINMNTGAAANGGSGIGVMTSAGNPWTIADELANELVNRGVATYADTQAKGLLPVQYDPLSGQQYAGGAPVSGAAVLASYDLVCYGATPNSLWAAMQAGRAGASVIVFEPSSWIGGMLTGGLAATDVAYSGFSGQIGGDATDFYRDLAAEVGVTYEYAWRNGLVFEPHIVQKVLNRRLAAANVKVVTNAPLKSVEKTATNLTALTCGNYRVTLWGWHDGTYEGDLFAMAGCSWTIGREANATYGESYNGIRPYGTLAQFADGVDPYTVSGDSSSPLLQGVMSEAQGSTGDSSPWIMAPNKRLIVCKSNPGNGSFTKLPMLQPQSYNPLTYEPLGRHAQLAASGWTTITSQMLYVSIFGTVKNDLNNGAIPQGINWINPSRYINDRILSAPDSALRTAFDADYDDYLKGFFKFVSTDTRFPAAVRADAASIGLCSDEFEAYGGWSPQLYVREGRRLVGDFVLKETHLLNAQAWTDGVAVAYYQMDSHHCRRTYVAGVGVKNEGFLLQAVADPPNEIPFRVMLPKVAESTNGTVGFGISASHTAFGSLRMEPIGMQLGQAAGMAHAIAKRRGIRVSQVAVAELKASVDRLKFNAQAGATLSADGTSYSQGTVTTTGTWNSGTVHVGEPPHFVATATGAVKRFAPNLSVTGLYKVSVRYPAKQASARSSVAPFDIVHAGGTTSITHNQNGLQASPGEGGDWVVLGYFTFRSGSPSGASNGGACYVDVKTDGAGAGTVVTAVKFELVR